ncbi:hypothetical protein VNI00_003838 [Paramarasmius palmivorus]|uniref:F-box domain-containing protein n=1 Tax=Paramarasmius palmivorus TaxID=297713 RepID=A0AAW0DLC8_9AGAR
MAHVILCNKCDAFIGFSTPPALGEQHRLADYVPSSHERIENLASIQEEEKLLENYDKEISQLREILGTLQKHRAALNQQISRRRSLISALRIIPPEILHEIFAFVCGDTAYSLVIPNSSPPPIFSISQVSSRWRRATLSQPKLWSSVYIDANLVRSTTRDVINTFLRNAGSHPLKLAVHASQFQHMSQFGEDALRMLLCHLKRCDELELKADWELLDRILLGQHLSQLSFPHLRIFIDNYALLGERATSPTYRWIFDALTRAPNLVELDTPNYHTPDALPFHRLTSLRTDELISTKALRMIGFCTNLKRLDIFAAEPEDLSAFTPVNLPFLQKLSIFTSAYTFSEAGELFSRLIMPQLEVLELESNADEVTEHDQSPPSLCSMLRLSSSSLQVLVLNTGDAPLPRTYYTDILQLLPNLNHFKAYNALPCTGDDMADNANSEYILHLIQCLTITADTSQSVLLPKLTTLRLVEENTRMTADYAVILLNMVESRRDTGSNTSMTRVELKYTPRWRRGADNGGDGALDSDHIANCASDFAIADRIELLAEDGIQCTIRRSRGWLYELE